MLVIHEKDGGVDYSRRLTVVINAHLKSLTLVIIPIILYGCQFRTDCNPVQPLYAGADRYLIRESSTVLIGKVLRVEASAHPVCVFYEAPIRAQFYQVELAVETAFRGGTEGGKLSFGFYYLIQASPARYMPEVGDRVLVFLKGSAVSLRAVSDQGRFAFLLTSERTHIKSKKGIAESIAASILTPSASADFGPFAKQLPETVLFLQVVVSRRIIFDNLKALMTHPDDRTRRAACGMISSHFYGAVDCLDKDSEEWRAARSRVPELIRALGDPANLDLLNLVYPDSHSARRDELVILTGHDNSEIRNLARRAIRRYYPNLKAGSGWGTGR